MIGTRVYVVYEQAVNGRLSLTTTNTTTYFCLWAFLFRLHLFCLRPLSQIRRRTRASWIMRSYIARYSQRLMLATLSCIAGRLPRVLYSNCIQCKCIAWLATSLGNTEAAV
jgi:hypothetical protein